MAPKDTTPHGGEIMQPPNRTIPEPKPVEEVLGPMHGHAEESREDAEPAKRPALPAHPEPMAADVEYEETDPVLDRGPGSADGLKSLKKQRG